MIHNGEGQGTQRVLHAAKSLKLAGLLIKNLEIWWEVQTLS